MKAREFWIEDDGMELHAQCEYFIGDNVIHVREVLSDEITDTMRLEWMIENEPQIFSSPHGWYIDSSLDTNYYNTPRDAIDAAMKVDKGKV